MNAQTSPPAMPAAAEGLVPLDSLELQIIDLTHKAVSLSALAEIVRRVVFSQLPFAENDETFRAFFFYADDILNDALRARQTSRDH